MLQRTVRYGQRRLVRKMVRAIPYLGGVVALVTLGSAMRRKGAVKGAVDTTLDFIPFVGGAKNVAEVLRGRDFFPDRAPSRAAVPSAGAGMPTTR
jgi:hypothetical protein